MITNCWFIIASSIAIYILVCTYVLICKCKKYINLVTKRDDKHQHKKELKKKYNQKVEFYIHYSFFSLFPRFSININI